MVCKSREEGGLGIRNLKVFNLALLGKWRWRFFNEDGSLWAQVLSIRYGVPSQWRSTWCEKTLEGGEVSYWWIDLGNLDGEDSSRLGWLSQGIIKKIG